MVVDALTNSRKPSKSRASSSGVTVRSLGVARRGLDGSRGRAAALLLPLLLVVAAPAAAAAAAENPRHCCCCAAEGLALVLQEQAAAAAVAGAAARAAAAPLEPLAPRRSATASAAHARLARADEHLIACVCACWQGLCSC